MTIADAFLIGFMIGFMTGALSVGGIVRWMWVCERREWTGKWRKQN